MIKFIKLNELHRYIIVHTKLYKEISIYFLTDFLTEF